MGKIMMYAGLALIVLAVILTVIFKIRKPVYQQAAQSAVDHRNEKAGNQPAVYDNPTHTAENTTVMKTSNNSGISAGSVKEQNKGRKIWMSVLLLALAGCVILGVQAFIGNLEKYIDKKVTAATTDLVAEQEDHQREEPDIQQTEESERDESMSVDYNYNPTIEYTSNSEEAIGYIEVKTAGLSILKGPSAEAYDTKNRTVVGDRYEVYEIITSQGYNWYRISGNTDWIADDNGKWMTFTPYETAETSTEFDPADINFIADEWHNIYLAMLEANNHGGDTSYLIQYLPERIEVYKENYTKYNAGFTFKNVYFDFDKTASAVTDLGSGNYEAECYAHAFNDTVDTNGNYDANEVLLYAKLIYDPVQKHWLLAAQRTAKNYSYTGHDMIHYE